MIIFCVTFDHWWSVKYLFYGAAGVVAKIGSSLKSNCQIKLNMSKSLIHKYNNFNKYKIIAMFDWFFALCFHLEKNLLLIKVNKVKCTFAAQHIVENSSFGSFYFSCLGAKTSKKHESSRRTHVVSRVCVNWEGVMQTFWQKTKKNEEE